MQCARVIALGGLAMVVASCDSKQAQMERERKAAISAKLDQDCSVMTKAIATMRQRARSDLVAADTSCWTIDTENCRIKVEMFLELNSANDPALANQVMTVGKDCSDEMQFENKYGLPVFREHRKLLEQAEKDAFEEGQAEALTPIDNEP